MATVQRIFAGSSSTPSNTAVRYGCFSGNGGASWTTTSAGARSVIAAAGILTNFKVKLAVAPGAGNDWNFIVMLNGSPTTLDVTISGTDVISALDTSQVTVAAGDTINIQSTPTSTPTDPTAIYWTCDFIPTTSGQTLCPSNGVDSNANTFLPLTGVMAGSATELDAQIIVPCNGTFEALYVQLVAAPGAGTSKTFTASVDGTPNSMAVTISDAATTGNNTANSFTVTAGQLVSIAITHSGAPAGSVVYLGMRFTPDTAGQFFSGMSNTTILSASANRYTALSGNTAPNATESEVLSLASATTAKAIYVKWSGDAGTAPDGYSFTLRKNATTDTALTVSIIAESKSGNASIDAAIADDDTLSVVSAPLNSPFTVEPHISLLFYTAPTGGTGNPSYYYRNQHQTMGAAA